LKKGINVVDVELIDENGKLKHLTSVQFSALNPMDATTLELTNLHMF
jgi:hypothetical protein